VARWPTPSQQTGALVDCGPAETVHSFHLTLDIRGMASPHRPVVASVAWQALLRALVPTMFR
jgi:hypothetical protein